MRRKRGREIQRNEEQSRDDEAESKVPDVESDDGKSAFRREISRTEFDDRARGRILGISKAEQKNETSLGDDEGSQIEGIAAIGAVNGLPTRHKK